MANTIKMMPMVALLLLGAVEAVFAPMIFSVMCGHLLAVHPHYVDLELVGVVVVVTVPASRWRWAPW